MRRYALIRIRLIPHQCVVGMPLGLAPSASRTKEQEPNYPTMATKYNRVQPHKHHSGTVCADTEFQIKIIGKIMWLARQETTPT